MNNQKNLEKGFTMVELLGSVVILGILMLVAIPAVSTYIKNSKERYYDTQKKQLVIAAKSYLSNTKSTPKKVGEAIDIPMDNLVKNKYITEIKDANKETCIGTKPTISEYDEKHLRPEELEAKKSQYTFVRVRRGTDKVHYTAHLWCVNRKEPKLTETERAPIEFEPEGIIEGGKRIAIIRMNIETDALTANSKLRIVDYSYTIYKGEINLVEKHGSINVARYNVRSDITRFTDNNSSNLKVFLRAVDSEGRVWTGEKSMSITAVGEKASCKDVKTKLDDNDILHYSFTCVSVNGCDSDVYVGEFAAKDKAETKNVTIRDKYDSNRNATCPIYVPAVEKDEETITSQGDVTDPDPPIPTAVFGCPTITKKQTGWLNKKLTIKYTLTVGTDGYYEKTPGKYVKKKTLARKLRKKKNKGHFRKIGNKTFKNVTWNSTSGRVIKKPFTTSGIYYFAVWVRGRRKATDKNTTLLCGKTYAYGPYKIDLTDPTYVKKSAKISGSSKNIKKLTIKFKVKDTYSGIYRVYVNETKKTSMKTIRKKGIKIKNKKSYSYKKTKKYSSGKHKFYAHILDAAGNYTRIYLGKKTIKKLKANCMHRSSSIHGTYGWTCTAGHYHTTAYYHLCINSKGDIYRASDFNFVCPSGPEKKYVPIPGT